MKNITPSSSSAEPAPEKAATPDAIGKQQVQTRQKVFKAVGKTADLALDSAEFVVETGGYAAGVTIRATGRGIWAMMKGITNQKYRHAA